MITITTVPAGTTLVCVKCGSPDIGQVIYGNLSAEEWYKQVYVQNNFRGEKFPDANSPTHKCRQCHNKIGAIGQTRALEIISETTGKTHKAKSYFRDAEVVNDG